MLINDKLQKVELGEAGIALQFKSGEHENISFSELHKIYLDVKKSPPSGELFLLFLVLTGFSSVVIYFEIELEILFLGALFVMFLAVITLLN